MINEDIDKGKDVIKEAVGPFLQSYEVAADDDEAAALCDRLCDLLLAEPYPSLPAVSVIATTSRGAL